MKWYAYAGCWVKHLARISENITNASIRRDNPGIQKAKTMWKRYAAGKWWWWSRVWQLLNYKFNFFSPYPMRYPFIVKKQTLNAASVWCGLSSGTATGFVVRDILIDWDFNNLSACNLCGFWMALRMIRVSWGGVNEGNQRSSSWNGNKGYSHLFSFVPSDCQLLFRKYE